MSTDDIDTSTGFSLSGIAADIDVTSIDIVGATAFNTSDLNIADVDTFIMNDGASANSNSVKVPASEIKVYMADLTLTTAAQTAITSVGVLTNLDVNQSGSKESIKIQYSGSGNFPCITLDQDDVDAPFIEFDGTAGAANTNSVVTTTGNVSGGINRFVKVKQGGTIYYLPLYAAS